jgi:hypothetical protein
MSDALRTAMVEFSPAIGTPVEGVVLVRVRRIRARNMVDSLEHRFGAVRGKRLRNGSGAAVLDEYRLPFSASLSSSPLPSYPCSRQVDAGRRSIDRPHAPTKSRCYGRCLPLPTKGPPTASLRHE